MIFKIIRIFGCSNLGNCAIISDGTGYLRDTREKVLVLGSNPDVELEGYVDADFAGDLDTRASTSGFVFFVYGGAVAWSSKKQNSVATSTVKAEFMAASAAIKEAAWLQSFLEELGCAPWKVKIHCDNQGCIQNLKNPIYLKYAKHIAMQFHFAREAIKKGQVLSHLTNMLTL